MIEVQYENGCTWQQFAPKWHHLKYRGGTFRHLRKLDPDYQDFPSKLRSMLDWLLESPDVATFTLLVESSDMGRNDLEVFEIKFKRISDAMAFKLTWM